MTALWDKLASEVAELNEEGACSGSASSLSPIRRNYLSALQSFLRPRTGLAELQLSGGAAQRRGGGTRSGGEGAEEAAHTLLNNVATLIGRPEAGV